MGPDGQKIIIYGGNPDTNTTFKNDELVVYNPSTNELTIPTIKNGKRLPSYGHTANIYGNYMIMAFGKYDKFTSIQKF